MIGRSHRCWADPYRDGPDPAIPGSHAVDSERLEGGDLLTVSTRHAAHALVVVRAVGEIDLLTGPSLDRALRIAVALAADDRHPDGGAAARVPAITTWTPEVRCDLDAVTFFGATGVSVLLIAAERARMSGVMLVVSAAGRPVCRVLSLFGLDDLLRTTTTTVGDTHTTTPHTTAPRIPLVETAALRRAVP